MIDVDRASMAAFPDAIGTFPSISRNDRGQPLRTGLPSRWTKEVRSITLSPLRLAKAAQKLKDWRKRMIRSENVTRRRVIQGAAGLAAAGTMGVPGILKGEDVLKFGHLTPLTGFLGPLGEFAQMGVKLALEEVNGAGGVMGRKSELVMEDSVNPQTASQKAERFVERDKVACII